MRTSRVDWLRFSSCRERKKNALNAGNLASLQLTESVSGPIMETYAPHSQLHSQCQSQFQPRVPVQLAVGLQVQSSLGLSLMPCWMTFYLIAVNFVPSALFKCKFYFFQLPTPSTPRLLSFSVLWHSSNPIEATKLLIVCPSTSLLAESKWSEGREVGAHNKKLSCKMWKTCWKTWGPNPNPPCTFPLQAKQQFQFQVLALNSFMAL